MKRVSTLVAILALAAVLAGASACNTVPTIGVAPGDTFELSLDSNPTTGYSWQAEFDQGYLEQVSYEFVPPQSEMEGAGGTEIFTFQALEVGETELTMVYKRNWESEPAKTRVFIIQIRDTFHVAPGDTFELSLDSNPTTGYSWQAEFDQEYLEQVSKEFVPSQSDMVGAGGTEIFTFQALEVGETELTMVYKRSWESESAETRVFIIQIVEAEG